MKNKYIYFHQNLFYICGRNMRKGLFFSARLLPMRNLKSGLPKGNILDITVLLAPILFIKVGFLHCQNFYSLISV